MGNIFEDKTTCEERTDMVVSAATVPADNSRRVRISKVDPFAPKNDVQSEDRPRYGRDY